MNLETNEQRRRHRTAGYKALRVVRLTTREFEIKKIIAMRCVMRWFEGSSDSCGGLNCAEQACRPAQADLDSFLQLLHSLPIPYLPNHCSKVRTSSQQTIGFALWVAFPG